MLPGIQNSLSAVKAYARNTATSPKSIASMLSRESPPHDIHPLPATSKDIEVEVGQSGSTDGQEDVGQRLAGMASGGWPIQTTAPSFRASDKTLGVLLDTVA